MRYHLILPFIGWILKKMFSGVIKIHNRYQKEMNSTPGLMVFIGILLSTLFTGVFTLSVPLIFGIELVRWSFYSSAFLTFTYVLVSFVSMLFNNFIEERQELFEVIKK